MYNKVLRYNLLIRPRVQLYSLVFNPRNARDHFMNIFKSITEDIFK